MRPAAPTTLGLGEATWGAIVVGCFLRFLAAVADRAEAARHAIRAQTTSSRIGSRPADPGLNHLSWVICSQLRLVAFGGSPDEFEVKVIDHRRRGHELSTIGIAS